MFERLLGSGAISLGEQCRTKERQVVTCRRDDLGGAEPVLFGQVGVPELGMIFRSFGVERGRGSRIDTLGSIEAVDRALDELGGDRPPCRDGLPAGRPRWRRA